MASYRVEVSHEVRQEIRQLPGNVRQRIFRTLQELAQEPRPYSSKSLDVNKLDITLELGADLRRIRLDRWRVIYLIEEDVQVVSVLAIRKRPPYQYEDLSDLLQSNF